ncbi:hypothetical protein [Archangium sp.]|uniref:hypothetical protein n=1 Tax=Archangium sp. TaxID=1872627 RepID=UPI002D237E32|nr:hypothetical protein [Archangium sp.]HYO59389.1 hypothetical protein [Archangium sp.]
MARAPRAPGQGSPFIDLCEQVEPGVFHFDAVQLGRDGQETGGVGYEIRTLTAQ